MKLRHYRRVLPPGDSLAKVQAIAWSPNNQRTAIACAGIVSLFDENGERRDKFATKPADKVRQARIPCPRVRGGRGARAMQTGQRVATRASFCAPSRLCASPARPTNRFRAGDPSIHRHGNGLQP